MADIKEVNLFAFMSDTALREIYYNAIENADTAKELRGLRTFGNIPMEVIASCHVRANAAGEIFKWAAEELHKQYHAGHLTELRVTDILLLATIASFGADDHINELDIANLDRAVSDVLGKRADELWKRQKGSR